jgi:transposase
MSGGSAAIPRAGCAMSATSRLGSSGPYGCISETIASRTAFFRPLARSSIPAVTLTGVALVMTRVDTAAMNLFLAELGQAVAPGAHGIVLMDKAGWHTAGDLVLPENLSLVFLPPYSPELNPIERLWLHLRDNRLSHCVFQTTGEIVDTCCDAWNWLLDQTGCIRSLCSYPWLERVSN